MADQLDYESFAGRTGETFRVVPPADVGEPLDLELVTLRTLEGSEHTKRAQSFAVEFRGPQDVALTQGMWRIEHPALGGHDIFLVPVGPDDKGLCYEAVFN